MWGCRKTSSDGVANKNTNWTCNLTRQKRAYQKQYQSYNLKDTHASIMQQLILMHFIDGQYLQRISNSTGNERWRIWATSWRRTRSWDSNRGKATRWPSGRRRGRSTQGRLYKTYKMSWIDEIFRFMCYMKMVLNWSTFTARKSFYCKSENKKNLLLKVSQQDNALGKELIKYCYFPNKLTNIGSAENLRLSRTLLMKLGIEYFLSKYMMNTFWQRTVTDYLYTEHTWNT